LVPEREAVEGNSCNLYLTTKKNHEVSQRQPTTIRAIRILSTFENQKVKKMLYEFD